MQLTPEQAGIARACGCQIVPATEEQVWRLSREHRIFRLDGAAVVVRRPDGFLETAGTLRLLLEQHAHAQDLAEAAPDLLPPSAPPLSTRPDSGPESPPFPAAERERVPLRRGPRGDSGAARRDPPPRPPEPEQEPEPAPRPGPRRHPAPTTAPLDAATGETGPVAPAPQPGRREAPPAAASPVGTPPDVPDRPKAPPPEAPTGTPGNSPGEIPREAPRREAPSLAAPLAEPLAGLDPQGESQEEPTRAESSGQPMGPRPEPAVPIAESVTPGYLVCLEDGRRVKMLTRHLKAAYGMTPDQYRARWGLPPDYPMVAPDSAERRAAARGPRATGSGRGGRAGEGAAGE